MSVWAVFAFGGAPAVIAQADCVPTVAFGTTFWPLDCVPTEDPPTRHDVKDELGSYLAMLVAAGADLSLGSEGGAWDCTVDGASIWVFVPDPLDPQAGSVDGLTLGANGIALNWNTFFARPPPVDPSELEAYLARLLTIIVHELYHTVFLDWLSSFCTGIPSCKSAWTCSHQQNGMKDTNPCVEWDSYAESARDLCMQACVQPPNSEMRLELPFQSVEQAKQASIEEQGCRSFIDPPSGHCPMPPFPPSAFPAGSQPPNVPAGCCCQELSPIENCAACNELTGDCDS